MADATCQHKEMENAVHVFPFMNTVEHSTGNVTYALSNYPYYCSLADAVEKWFEGNQDAKPHRNKAYCLEIAMRL